MRRKYTGLLFFENIKVYPSFTSYLVDVFKLLSWNGNMAITTAQVIEELFKKAASETIVNQHTPVRVGTNNSCQKGFLIETWSLLLYPKYANEEANLYFVTAVLRLLHVS